MKKKLIIALAITIIATLSATGCATGNGSNPAEEAMVPENSISGDEIVSADEIVSVDEIVSADEVVSPDEVIPADELPEESDAGEEVSGNMDETEQIAEYRSSEIVVTYNEPEEQIEVKTTDGEILDIVSLDNAGDLMKYDSETVHYDFPIVYIKEHSLLIVTCFPEDMEISYSSRGTTYYFRVNEQNELVYIDSEYDCHNDGWSNELLVVDQSCSEEDFYEYINLTLIRYELNESNFVWESPEEMKQAGSCIRLYYDSAMEKYFIFHNEQVRSGQEQWWRYDINEIKSFSVNHSIPPLFDDTCEISNYEKVFCNLREEREYSEDGQLLKYELYGTVIEGSVLVTRDGRFQAGDEVFLTGVYYEYDEEGNIFSWEKRRNRMFWGSSETAYICYFDKMGRCIGVSYLMVHGYDNYYYVYLDDSDTPQYYVSYSPHWNNSFVSVY